MTTKNQLNDTFNDLLCENVNYIKTLYLSRLETKLGTMVALADTNALYLLDFTEGRYLKRHCEELKKETESNIVLGRTSIIDILEKELHLYCEGKIKEFKTPYLLCGTQFQKNVWNKLQKIPYGQTLSYKKVADLIEKPQAMRAVGRANSTNKLVLIVPCHRVINANGDLGGYSGGIKNKQWLLAHEGILMRNSVHE